MMRGPSYDDNYIARKMTSLQNSPTFMTPGRGPAGGYMQPLYSRGQHRMYFRPGVVTDVWYLPKHSDRLRYLRDWQSSSTYIPSYSSYVPSSYRYSSYIPYLGYSPLPPPRMAPRMAPPPPAYCDDYYGYGGGYGGYGGYSPYSSYGYGGGYYQPPTQPRYRGYSPYLEDDYDYNYTPRYRPRLSETLLEMEKEKPQLAIEEAPSRKTRQSRPRHTSESAAKVESESDKLMKYLSNKYPTFNESQMLQDQVDNMRIRLKALAFSLDPSGPVPEIILPQRSRRVDNSSEDLKKKYTSALELETLPRLSTRRHHYYPEDEHMKDNLRIKCLSHYKSTRTQAEYWKPKGYYGDQVSTYSLPNYTSRYASGKAPESSKWEEPDKVYATSKNTERKPYSKGADIPEEEEVTKERRKKKKSKERDYSAIEAAPDSGDASASSITKSTFETAAPAAVETTEVSAPTAAPATEPEIEMDEKERKRMEKKKRKAEREAAAKAAMEAELEALAAAEEELAKLEAQSASIKVTDPNPAEAEQASASAADKCESDLESREFECEPSSFDVNVNESLQEHEADLQVPDDPVVPDYLGIEETYEAEPVMTDPQEEQFKVTAEEEIFALLDEETVPPQIGNDPLGTEEPLEVAQEQLELFEEQEQPEEPPIVIEQPAEPQPVEPEQVDEFQEELVDPSLTDYIEVFEQPIQPEEDVVQHLETTQLDEDVEQHVETTQQPEEQEAAEEPLVTTDNFWGE